MNTQIQFNSDGMPINLPLAQSETDEWEMTFAVFGKATARAAFEKENRNRFIRILRERADPELVMRAERNNVANSGKIFIPATRTRVAQTIVNYDMIAIANWHAAADAATIESAIREVAKEVAREIGVYSLLYN